MKTPTQQFIEDAIAGGWNPQAYEISRVSFEDDQETIRLHLYMDTNGETVGSTSRKIHKILLDPLAWQAVGKTRGWGTYKPGGSFYVGESSNQNYPRWKKPWHFFIDHLADGKTIDESLAAISQGV